VRPALILKARGSHLYPGARAVLEDGQSTAGPALVSCHCLIEFADGSVAFGTLTNDKEGFAVLAVDAYQTARGTAILAKGWRLSLAQAMEGGRACRIEGRIVDDSAGPG
jgi:hypothetical protein